MTIRNAEALVAKDFVEFMQENGFLSFKEMRQCFKWDSQDIKEEVDAALRDLTKGEYCVDELDGSMVVGDGDLISYGAFMKDVYEEIEREMAA